MKHHKYLLFGSTLIIASIFYTIASFYTVHKSFTIPIAIIVSIGFASLEYSIKIPTFKFGKDFLSVADIQLTWVAVTFMTTMVYQIMVIKHPVKRKTIITAIIIIGALIYNYK